MLVVYKKYPPCFSDEAPDARLVVGMGVSGDLAFQTCLCALVFTLSPSVVIQVSYPSAVLPYLSFQKAVSSPLGPGAGVQCQQLCWKALVYVQCSLSCFNINSLVPVLSSMGL